MIDSLRQQLLCWLHARFIPVHHSQIFICLRQLDCEGQNLVSLTAPSRGAQIVVLLWITSMSTYQFTFNILMISAVKLCVDPSQKVSHLRAYEQKSPFIRNFSVEISAKNWLKIVFWYPGVYFIHHLIILNSSLTWSKIQFCISLPSFLNARVKRSFQGKVLYLQYIWQQT